MKDKQKTRNAVERAARDAELCARKTQAWDTEQEAARFCEELKREHFGTPHVDRYPFECRACGKWHVSTLRQEERRAHD